MVLRDRCLESLGSEFGFRFGRHAGILARTPKGLRANFVFSCSFREKGGRRDTKRRRVIRVGVNGSKKTRRKKKSYINDTIRMPVIYAQTMTRAFGSSQSPFSFSFFSPLPTTIRSGGKEYLGKR